MMVFVVNQILFILEKSGGGGGGGGIIIKTKDNAVNLKRSTLLLFSLAAVG